MTSPKRASSRAAELFASLQFIHRHPLAAKNRAGAYARWLRWQIGSRLVPGDVAVPFVDGARLLVRHGMTGATGNIYAGLHELDEMAFVLHALRPGDLFVDAGANVGSYTVLASTVCGAHVLAVEPIPAAYADLAANVRLNAVGDRVAAHNLGLGAARARLRFTADLDSMNRVLGEGEAYAGAILEVEVATIDALLEGKSPVVMKLDVEGYETEVLAGAAGALERPELRAILVEDLDPGAGGRKRPGEVLAGYGFRPYRYDPFARELEEVRAPIRRSGNTLYVRDVAWARERVSSAPRREILGVDL